MRIAALLPLLAAAAIGLSAPHAHAQEPAEPRDAAESSGEAEGAERRGPLHRVLAPARWAASAAIWNEAKQGKDSDSGIAMSGIQLGAAASTSHGHAHGVQAAGGISRADANASGVQIAGLAAVARGDLHGLQIAGMGGGAGAAHGVQLGGFGNFVEGNAYGVMAGGLANGVDGDAWGLHAAGYGNVIHGRAAGIQAGLVVNLIGSDAAGFQAAGLINQAMGGGTGLQIAGIHNSVGWARATRLCTGASVGRLAYRGMQVGGFANMAEADFVGLQAAGIANRAETIRGAQFALLINSGFDAEDEPGEDAEARPRSLGLQAAVGTNVARGGLTGVQAAIHNRADRIDGFQIGLVNSSREVRGAQVGLVNLRNGRLSWPLLSPGLASRTAGDQRPGD